MQIQLEQANRLTTTQRLLVCIGSHWPQLPFMSLGLYAAWILICTASGSLFMFAGHSSLGELQGTFYLYSGLGLLATLLLAGIFDKQIHPLVESGHINLAGGALATAATLAVAWGNNLPGPLLISVCISTGIGTGLLCLRIGLITSKLNGPQGFFTIMAAGLLSNLLFFMCRSLPGAIAIIVTALLPLTAAAVTFAKDVNNPLDSEDVDLIDIHSLPKGYFPRMCLAIFSFSLSVGLAKGIPALTQGATDFSNRLTLEVFASFVSVLAILIIVTIIKSIRNFDISKIYLPIVLIGALTVLLTPICAPNFENLPYSIVAVAYNVFAMVIWCLLADLAGRTTLSSTRVFGLGRGVSGLATTLGWLVPMTGKWLACDMTPIYTALSCIAGICILVVAVFGFNERTISDALKKTIIEDTSNPEHEATPILDRDNWTVTVSGIAQEHGLTARESEVFALLASGRSIVYIAEELTISYNTAKGYTRNIYTKLDLHSRQELIDWVETNLASPTI